MLKYIGITLFILGAALLLYSIINSRKDGYKESKTELAMIMSAGYATRHVEAARPEAVLNQTPIKAAPRQRSLSKEALDLLDLVEDEREKERIEEMKKPKKKKGTDVLTKPIQKGTDILPKAGKKTDVIDGNKGTDVLPANTGTDVMTEKKGTDVLKDSSGTDVLLPKSKGTDIMAPKETDALPASRGGGTDILGEA